jgi:hypothetical protein
VTTRRKTQAKTATITVATSTTSQQWTTNILLIAAIAVGLWAASRNPIQPGPVDPVPPPPPVVNVQSLVDSAIADQRQGFARAFHAAADAIAAGTMTTDAEYQSALAAATQRARQEAFAPIDQHIESKLPRVEERLMPDAAGFSREIGDAFAGGRK